MANGRFISYLRVSTDRQGKSGLGLEAQRAAVETYLNGGRWRIVKEFVEVESGRNADRPALAEALAACRVHRIPLVVAKVDRLTRSLAFLSRLLEAGVDVRFCDLPQIEGPAGRFMLQQMAAVAELEAGMISKRTKDALAAKKLFYERLTPEQRADILAGRVEGKKAVQLGGDRGARLSDAARDAGRQASSDRAKARAVDLSPVVEGLRSAGVTTLAGIAAGLNEKNVPTARGGAWSPVQVSRLLTQIATI